MGQINGLRRQLTTLFPLDARRRAFKSAVEEVNIEISSYCNRTCVYCPNAYHGKIERKDLDASILERLLADLGSIGYDGLLNFNLYNEPLHDYDLFCRAFDASKRHVPDCWFRLNSNGDYVTKAIMQDLLDQGFHEIVFSIHYRDGWNAEAQLAAINHFIKRSGLPPITPTVTEGCISSVQTVGKTRVKINSIDYLQHGTDRGGEIGESNAKIVRSAPCELPKWQINVNFEGDVYPCCNIYPRKDLSGEYRLGSLRDSSIFDIYFSEPYQTFMRTVMNATGNADLPECCRGCNECRDLDRWTPFTPAKKTYRNLLGASAFWR